MHNPEPLRRRCRTSDYPCQYRVLDSMVHRLGAGWKLLLWMGLSAAAITARQPWELAIALALVLAYYFAAKLSAADLWRDTRFFLLQAALVIGLYCIRSGTEGIWPGARISLQILLAFLPGMIFLQTTKTTALMRGMDRILPYRLSFLVFISLRFVPFFTRELREITLAQRLRGARISAVELIDPRNWRDLLHCLLLPLLVRALKTAEEVALAATAREFGVRPCRTYCGPLGAATTSLSSAREEGEKAPSFDV